MFAKIKLVLAILKAIKDPRQTEAIGKAVDGFANPERFRVALDKVSDDPITWERVVRREPVPPVNLEELKRCEPGTLGHGLYRHLTDNGLDPNLLPVQVKDTETYVRSRYRMAHDTWHVVGGYSTSIKDELELQALTFAQIHGPGSALVLGIGLFHYVAFKPNELPEVIRAMVRGYLRGSKAKPLLGINWHEHWHRPLREIRKMLNMEEAAALPLDEAGITSGTSTLSGRFEAPTNP